jgi:hypothetical protein
MTSDGVWPISSNPIIRQLGIASSNQSWQRQFPPLETFSAARTFSAFKKTFRLQFADELVMEFCERIQSTWDMWIINAHGNH